MHNLILFAQSKYNIRVAGIAVKLPAYGHICLHVHQGYKIFNLRKRTVIKLFDSAVNRDRIMDEIKRLQTVSCIDFAPSLGKWNINEKWYEEEYILEYPPSSYKSQNALALVKNINRDIIPCLNQLMLFKQTKSINSLDYVSKLIGILEAYESYRKENDNKDIAKIRDFIKSVSEKIQSKGNTDIYLIFSHGDFCPANIMDTKHGIRILDWESAEYRSSFFDFYSFFFYLPVCVNYPLDQLVTRLNETLKMFIFDLALKDANIQKNLKTNKHVYRWIFYIEYICRLVDRELTDNNLNIMDFIIRYIHAFNRYEMIIASNLTANIAGQTNQSKT